MDTQHTRILPAGQVQAAVMALGIDAPEGATRIEVTPFEVRVFTLSQPERRNIQTGKPFEDVTRYVVQV